MKTGRARDGVGRSSKKIKGKGKGALSEFFDSRTGIIVATILSLILWWVPYLGPMVSGFMGGRKAGSLFRGLIVGSIACILVLIITGVLNFGVSALIEGKSAEAISGFNPALLEAFESFRDYLDTFIVVEGTSVSFDQSTYFLMIALAVIGGAVADQARGEVKAIVSLSKESNQAPLPRSVRAFRNRSSMGFQSYDDYARMSVNVTEASAAKNRERPVFTETVQETPAVQVHQVPVTDTVYTSTATSTVTSEPVTTDVPEKKKPEPPVQNTADDYEYL